MTLRRRVLGSVGCNNDGHLLGSGRVQNDNVAVQLQHAHAPGGRRHLHAAVTNFAGCTSTDKPACFSTLYARLSGHLPAPLPSLWNDRLHIPVAHGEAAHGPGRVAGIQGLVRVVELTIVVAEDAKVLERADGGLDLEVACAAKRLACVGRNMHIVELPRVHVSVDVLADILPGKSNC